MNLTSARKNRNCNQQVSKGQYRCYRQTFTNCFNCSPFQSSKGILLQPSPFLAVCRCSTIDSQLRWLYYFSFISHVIHLTLFLFLKPNTFSISMRHSGNSREHTVTPRSSSSFSRSNFTCVIDEIRGKNAKC